MGLITHFWTRREIEREGISKTFNNEIKLMILKYYIISGMLLFEYYLSNHVKFAVFRYYKYT